MNLWGTNKPDGAQPFHLDNGAPWMWDNAVRNWWTTQSIVVQLTDGPMVDILEDVVMKEDIWNEEKMSPQTLIRRSTST